MQHLRLDACCRDVAMGLQKCRSGYRRFAGEAEVPVRPASGLVPACRDSQQELKDRIREAVALPVRIAIKGDCLGTAHAWGSATQRVLKSAG